MAAERGACAVEHCAHLLDAFPILSEDEVQDSTLGVVLQSKRLSRHHAWMIGLRREPHGAGSAQRLPEPREHHKISVDADASEAARAERHQPVLVLEPAELPFHGDAATVEALPLVGAVGNAVERDGAVLSKRDDG